MKPKYILNIADYNNIFLSELPSIQELYKIINNINEEYEFNETDYNKLLSTGKMNLNYYSD